MGHTVSGGDICHKLGSDAGPHLGASLGLGVAIDAASGDVRTLPVLRSAYVQRRCVR